MKQIIIISLSILFIGFSANAQKATDKVSLTEGQLIKMTTEMKSDMDRQPQGKMKTDMTLLSEMKVAAITDKGYELEATMKKAKMSFEGFGMTQEYDSEDPDKKEGMIAQGFEKALNKTEKVLLGFDGKVIKDETDTKKNGGMMRMMGGADVASTIEGVFLLLPKDLEIGKKWRTTTENEGLKVITEYIYKGMMGNMANLTANQQSKGEIAAGRGGTVTVNQLTQMTLMVDATSGLISMKTSTTKDKSVTEMGDQTYKNDGVTTMSVTCE